MKSWKKPTPEQVDRAIALLAHKEQSRYFFDRLNNPEWIKPLNSKGFFLNPPRSEVDDKTGTIGFPIWPESRYLARMASFAPEVVLEIILKIQDTDNVRIYEDLADAALAMPAEVAVKLTNKAKIWTQSRYHLILPEKLGALVARFAESGYVDKALDLARILLDVIDAPNKIEPATRFDVWEYQRIVEKNIPKLADAGKDKAFMFLSELLQKCIRLSKEKGDYSYIWRPAIENHAQNNENSVRAILVSAVRDTAEYLAKNGILKVPMLIKILEEQDCKIFHRIALHLLRLFPQAAPNLVLARLTNRKIFDDASMKHEYSLLLRDCFSTIGLNKQNVILGWIEEGPDIERFKKMVKDRTDKELPEGEVVSYKETWQRDRLFWFKADLPDSWKRLYETFIIKYGEPEHPDFSSYVSAGWVGPTSPKTAEELRTMAVNAIVEFMRTWKPSNDEMSPSPEGFGRVFSSIVAENPVKFVREANFFRGLNQTYIRTFLIGLQEAIQQKRPFEWSLVIDLCLWAVQQPNEIKEGRHKIFDSDPDWGYARKSIARLLSVGFEEGSVSIPFNHRESVWKVLQILTDDPDPTPEHEASCGGTNRDYTTLAINTTRGEALNAVMHYALWIRRNLERLPDSAKQIAQGFEIMPEVRKTLEEHLNIARDPSFAIRSVYGKWFPWLVLFDPNWAKSNETVIFPETEPESEFYHVAWDTYVTFCAPYDNVFEILYKQYKRAIENIDLSRKEGATLSNPNEDLAEHLVTFYWRGKLNISEPENLFMQFWNKVPNSLRGHAITFVGRSLYNTKEEVPREILVRLQTLWDMCLTNAKEASASVTDRAEMVAFSWWFISGKFDDTWTISQLKEALKIAGKAEPDHLVVERLATLAQKMPKETLDCLEIVIRGDREGWGIYGWREQAQAILKIALNTSEPETVKAAENLIHYLGSRGYLEFRDLL